MKFAVLSDVHSNLEALHAVLEDIDQEGVKNIHFLGDIIGYGANPLEVFELYEKFEVKILGNHDQGVIESALLFFFNPAAKKALEWTKRIILEAGQQQFLEQLRETPMQVKEKKYIFSHGDYKQNQKYLQFQNETVESFHYLENCNLDILFVGHSHHQGYFTRDGNKFTSETFDLPLDKLKKQPFIINPGSVGQPRDGNPKAAYIIVEEERIQFRRVSYDIETAAAKIRSEKDLPDALAFRLFEGR